VVVNEVQPLEAVASRAKPEVLIRLKAGETSETLLDDLENLLMSHPGDSPVTFELVQPGNFAARLRAHKPFGVKADEPLLAQLKTLCGQEAVSIERRKSANGQP
jgi:hypothetical protein